MSDSGPETKTEPAEIADDAVIPTTALVTGANRGLGLEIARQLGALGTTVFLGSRESTNGDAAAEELRREGHDVRAVQLDVTDQASVDAAAVAIAAEVDHLDVLVNNAGGNFDFGHAVLGSDVEMIAGIVDANCFGAMRCVNALLDLLRAAPNARIVNVTSEAGSHAGPMGLPTQQDNLAGYAVAKAAQNAYTRKLASALEDSSVLVTAISPGFVATQPGSENMGARPVSDGAMSVVWGATLPVGTPTGGYFRDGVPVEF
ncbi:MAG: SDR family NAD(P)-dependent oxidoreductase [Actinomycetia bacterium]|nr:SDR family NAD(P)-dependent oxidoreductase [Actinomycetes bacterium]